MLDTLEIQKEMIWLTHYNAEVLTGSAFTISFMFIIMFKRYGVPILYQGVVHNKTAPKNVTSPVHFCQCNIKCPIFHTIDVTYR